MNVKFFNKSSEERRNMILSEKVLKTIIILTIPMFMMGIVQALIPITDGLFLNNKSGYVIAGAIGFSQSVIGILNAFSQGLSVAASAIIGQLYGKGDIEKTKHSSVQILVLSFGIGLLLSPLCLILYYVISRGVNEELSAHVFEYLGLYSFVLPFLFMAAIFNSIKNGTGHPEAPFLRMIILLIFKIVFNTIFLSILNLGVFGAVSASFMSYFLIGIWMYYDLFIKKSDMQLSLKNFRFDFEFIKKTMALAIPSILSYILVYIGFFLINKEVVKYGSIALNASTIASNINSIYFVLPTSVGTTVTTMISMNIGNGNSKNAKKVFYYGILFSLMIVFSIIIIFTPLNPYIVELFQKNPEITTITNKALTIYMYSVIGFGIFTVEQGVFIGLGRTKMPLLTGIMRVWLLRYIFIIFTEKYLGVYSIFWGNLFSNCMAAFIFFFFVMKVKWESAIKDL